MFNFHNVMISKDSDEHNFKSISNSVTQIIIHKHIHIEPTCLQVTTILEQLKRPTKTAKGTYKELRTNSSNN